MSLFVYVFFDLVYRSRDWPVAALLFQTFQAGKDTIGQKGLLFLYRLDVPVLLLLLQVPSVNRENHAEYDTERGKHRCYGYDCLSNFHTFLLIDPAWLLGYSLRFWGSKPSLVPSIHFFLLFLR